MDQPLTTDQLGTLSAIAMGVAVPALVAAIIAIGIACKALFKAYDNSVSMLSKETFHNIMGSHSLSPNDQHNAPKGNEK